MRKQMNSLSKLTTYLVIGAYLAGSLTLPSPAWAVLGTTNNANSYNDKNLPASGDNCDDICALFEQPVDDQWCANHGAQTNVSVPAAQNKPTLAAGCNVPLASGENCEETNKKIKRCKLQNTEIQTKYCLAYNAAMDGKDNNTVALAMDAAAAGVCGLSCTQPYTSMIGNVCTVAATAAGVTEIIETTKMQQSETGRIIHLLAGAAGVAGGIAVGVNRSQNLASNGAEKNKGACAAAVFYAALTGVRIYNIHQMEETRSKACDNIKSLLSTATASSTEGGGSSGGQGSGGNTHTDGLGSGGSGGNTANNGSTTVNPTTNADHYGPCPGNATMTCRVASASTGIDSHSMDSSNLNPLVAPRAQALESNGLKNKIARGASAGQIVAEASGGNLGTVGDGLAALADAAQRNPNEALSLFPNASSVMSSGGGGGGAKSDNPFSSLFGGGGGMGAGMAQGPGLASFKSAPGAQDIWHTNTQMNLFEIVSDKIGKVTHRLR